MSTVERRAGGVQHRHITSSHPARLTPAVARLPVADLSGCVPLRGGSSARRVAAEESLARALRSWRKTEGCCSWLSLSLLLALSLASLDPQMPMVGVCVYVCVAVNK